MTECTIKVELSGTVSFIWHDELGDALRDLGAMHVTRASHVEPNAEAQWEADLAPVGGPVLGPFTHRQEALDAEVAWLLANRFGV